MRPFISFLILAVLLTACSSHKPSVVGKWRPVEFDGAFLMNNHMSDEQIKKVKAESTVEFQPGGRFIGMTGKDTTETGSYEYKESEKLLITNGGGGRKETMTVLELTAKQMVVTSEQGKITLKRD